MPFYSGTAKFGTIPAGLTNIEEFLTYIVAAMESCGWTNVWDNGTTEYHVDSATTIENLQVYTRLLKQTANTLNFGARYPRDRIAQFGAGHGSNLFYWDNTWSYIWFGCATQFILRRDKFDNTANQRVIGASALWTPPDFHIGVTPICTHSSWDVSGETGSALAGRDGKALGGYAQFGGGDVVSYDISGAGGVSEILTYSRQALWATADMRNKDVTILDPLYIANLRLNGHSSQDRIIGALWDSVIVSTNEFEFGEIMTFDGKEWMCMTHLSRDGWSLFLLKTQD